MDTPRRAWWLPPLVPAGGDRVRRDRRRGSAHLLRAGRRRQAADHRGDIEEERRDPPPALHERESKELLRGRDRVLAASIASTLTNFLRPARGPRRDPDTRRGGSRPGARADPLDRRGDPRHRWVDVGARPLSRACGGRANDERADRTAHRDARSPAAVPGGHGPPGAARDRVGASGRLRSTAALHRRTCCPNAERPTPPTDRLETTDPPAPGSQGAGAANPLAACSHRGARRSR